MFELTPYLLTADVGGTNSRMCLYTLDSTVPLVVKYYRNEDVLKEKLDDKEGSQKDFEEAKRLADIYETQKLMLSRIRKRLD